MHQSHRFCPRLEVLEERATPTVFTFPVAQSPVLLFVDSGHYTFATPGNNLVWRPEPAAQNVTQTPPYQAAVSAYANAGVSLPAIPGTPVGILIAAAPT